MEIMWSMIFHLTSFFIKLNETIMGSQRLHHVGSMYNTRESLIFVKDCGEDPKSMRYMKVPTTVASGWQTFNQ